MTDNNSNEFTHNNSSNDEFPAPTGSAAGSTGSDAGEPAPSFNLGPPGGVQPRSASTRSGQLAANSQFDDELSVEGPDDAEPADAELVNDELVNDELVNDELVNDELVEPEIVEPEILAPELSPSSSIPTVPQTHPSLIEATTDGTVYDDARPAPMTPEEARLFDANEPGYSMSDLSPAEQAYMAGDTSLAEDSAAITERALSTEKNLAQESPREDDDPNAPSNDRELDLIEHLRELRARLLNCVYAIALAMCITWNFGTQVSDWFAAPIRQALRMYGPKGSTIQAIEPTESFMVYLQITAVAAILIVMPFILFQLWRFIEPAMTRREKRYTKFLVPFSIILFFSGCALGYYVSPLFFRFFLQFQPANMPANYAYQTSVVLLAKMLLVFGVCFQVPVVTVFLTKAGIVTRNILIEYWRHAVVVIFTVVAILTPTWDPVTLMVCAIPPSLLYIFSIWLVKWL